SKLGASDSIAEIAGPGLTGPLVQLVGAPIAILFDACSFLFSAACVLLIRTPERSPKLLQQPQSIWQDIVEGLHLILHNPLLRVLAGSSAIFNFFGNFIGT